MIEADLARLWPADQVFHVHYKALTSDPVSAVGRLYDALSLDFTPAFRSALTALVLRNPDGGYARNVYDFKTFGLSAGQERENYKDYMRHFDVDEEVKLS
jgi:hypothetical protein